MWSLQFNYKFHPESVSGAARMELMLTFSQQNARTKSL